MKVLLLLLSVTLFIGCKRNRSENTGEKPLFPDNTIVLNKEQIKLANISTGKISKKVMGRIVECNRTVISHPNSVAIVNPPMGGYIRSILFIPGNFVAKGTVIAVLEHPDYIRLQQEFLEAKNQLELYQEEFKRQGELTVENASSIKKMQQAQADYRITEVQYLSLKAQLKLIGINADSLYTDGIKTSIKIRAPISGTVSRVSASIGKYAGPDEMIYEIINTHDLHLHLNIFEKDIPFIKKGLLVNFWPASAPGQKYNAIISTVSQKLDKESNTFDTHARVLSGRDQLKSGMHVYAEIHLSQDSVYALPADAIFTSEGSWYAFLSDDSVFIRFEIEAGLRQSGFIELVNFPDSLTGRDIVVSGAYYLNAEMASE